MPYAILLIVLLLLALAWGRGWKRRAREAQREMMQAIADRDFWMGECRGMERIELRRMSRWN